MFPRRRRVSSRRSRHGISRQRSSLFESATVEGIEVLLLDMAMNEQRFLVHSRLVYSWHLMNANDGLHRVSDSNQPDRGNDLLCCTRSSNGRSMFMVWCGTCEEAEEALAATVADDHEHI